MDTPKQKFKRYEIIEELGMGGMAAVYRAYDPLFEREVALKVLKRELLEDAEVRERFERETKIVAKLEHAAIVPVYDIGDDNDQLFYVMRYMSGGSLSERINEGRLDFAQVSSILLRLVDALDYAHRKGIVHRDLKPGNILFDESGNAFISDFGIAKFVQAGTRITHSGIIGTPRYISPEQARGEETDGRSDLYTLSVLFFEIFSGKAPFEAATPLALAFKHAAEPAPDILSFNPGLPRALSDVFRTALQKEPAARYQTCAELASAFLEAFPADTAPDTQFPRPSLPHTARKHEEPAKAPHVHEPGTKTRPWIIGGFIVLALLGFAVRGCSQLTTTIDVSASTLEPVIATDIPPTPISLPTTSASVIPVNEWTMY